jgi:hypothetical protein
MEEATTPAPDAPAPNMLREEIALIIKHQYLSVSTNIRRAHETADLIIAKLMVYYDAAATPEVTEDAMAVVSALQTQAHAVDAAISAGATMAPHFTHDIAGSNWQKAAARLRESTAKVMELLT